MGSGNENEMEAEKRNPGNEVGQDPVVGRVDSAIHWINHYPLEQDNSIGFASVHPLDSDLVYSISLPTCGFSSI